MDLTKLRYWQWLLISLALGAGAAELRIWAAGLDGSVPLPTDLSGQQSRFESALIGSADGHALLRNIRVSSMQLPGRGGTPRAVNLVRADYCTGQPEWHNGPGQYIWRDSLFVLPVPYRASRSLSEADPALATELARRARPGRQMTVLDLLDAARIVHGTRYSYAWWDSHPWLACVGASVLLIGLLFPALIHLSAFGRLTRPAEPSGVSLVGVKRRPAAAAAVPVAVDPTAAGDLDQELEASLAGAGLGSEVATGNDSPPRALSAGPLRPVEASADEQRQFGANREDYYPTELGAKHAK